MEFYVDKNIKNLHRIKCSEDRTNYLRLDMNENPEGLPREFVNEVLKKITPEFIAKYPQKEELIRLLAKTNKVSCQNVSLTNGSDEAMRLIFETFGEDGKEVVSVTPSFEMYDIYAKMFGMNNVKISYDENLEININHIISSINSNTRIVVLLNPNSPIGNVYSEDEMIQIVERAKLFNSIVIIDEAYHYFYSETFLNLVNQYENVLLIRTFSKLFSIAALRVGYIIGSKVLVSYIENAQSTYNVNAVGILFAEEILKNGSLLKELVDIEKEGHEYIIKALEENGYKIHSTNGNYLIFKSKISPFELAQKLKSKGVLIKTYRSGILSEYVRITTGSKRIMKEFLAILLSEDV